MADQERKSLLWRRSSRSGKPNNNCVEVATVGDAVLIRDSAYPVHVLAIDRLAWSVLVGSLLDLSPMRPHRSA